jgi:putative CocE/NonD family hydrolase
MTLLTRVTAALAKLPRARTHDVAVERDLKVPMDDGVTLVADRYCPRDFTRGPVVLIRSPYGRRGPLGALLPRLIAERGFQVVLQSVRGTFGSGGEFDPFVNEGRDGTSTVEWLRKQPWYDGTLATFGPSYLGLVQWALAPAAGAELKAMTLQITASQFRDQTYTGESFSLATALIWSHGITFQERGFWAATGRRRRVARGAAHLPLAEADRVTVGETRSFYQDWLKHTQPDSAFWAARDYSAGVPETNAAIDMVGGWFDIFLPWMLEDYRRLRAAGREPFLLIGPWAHTDGACFAASMRESLAWLKAHILGERSDLRPTPVRVYVMGAKEWRDLPDWPPAEAQARRWHLHAGALLATAGPRASQPDRYRYDPANPTPSVGGVWLGPGSGAKDNARLEKRSDVLVYTSAVLENDVEVIGDVSAELYVRSTLPDTDFFVRLCDVEPLGRSVNICDGVIRLKNGAVERQLDGTLKIIVKLWPTAHRFLCGHRVRLQVSSGAHPRFARNTGSGEPLGTARKMWIADQTIFHDPAHPSAVILPVVAGNR